MRFGASHDQGVGVLGVVEAETMGGQGSGVQANAPPGPHQVQRSLQVLVLGPAHESGRVLEPTGFVVGVVPARAVGSGDRDRQLLLHELPVGECGAGVSDERYDGSIPGHLRGCLERGAGLGRGGDDHGVATQAACCRHCGGPRVSAVQVTDLLRAETAGKLQAGGVEIESQHPHAGQGKKLRSELADQPNPDDGAPCAQLGPCQAYAVQGDGAQGSVTRLFVRNSIRNGRGQIVGNDVQFGVVRQAGPGDRDPLARPVPALQAGADLDRDTGGRIAQRQRLVQARHDRAGGFGETVPPGLADCLADQIRAGARLLEQALPGKPDRQALGAGRDQRRPGPDQQMARPDPGGRDRPEAEFPAPGVLDDLLHAGAAAPATLRQK